MINKGKNKDKSEILKNTMNIPITISANKIKNIRTKYNLELFNSTSLPPLCFKQQL